MHNFKLDGPAEHALNRIQDTELTPMEEVLFKSWATANGIKKPDNADDPMDYRGLWKSTGGKILPQGQLERIVSRKNAETTLVKTLTDRLKDAAISAEQKAQAKAKADIPKPPQG